MTTAVPNFGSGGEEAQALADSMSGGKFARTEYLRLADGESIVLRFLQDSKRSPHVEPWKFVQQHPSVPTKNPPPDYKGNWPKVMPAVCRKDQAFQGVGMYPGGADGKGDCYIDDAGLKDNFDRPCKPVVRVWCIAVVREPVIGTEEMVAAGSITADKIGRRVGFRDALREVERTDKDGKVTEKYKEPRLIVVNMGMKNFFTHLQGAYAVYGTVCDRDFHITRRGDGKDTEYNIVALDPTPNLAPGTERWDKYLKAMEDQNLSLNGLMAEHASDEYFARFFDPNKTPSPSKKSDRAGTGQATEAPEVQQVATPSAEATEAQLEALRNKIRPRGGTVTAEAEAVVQETVPAAAGAVDFD